MLPVAKVCSFLLQYSIPFIACTRNNIHSANVGHVGGFQLGADLGSPGFPLAMWGGPTHRIPIVFVPSLFPLGHLGLRQQWLQLILLLLWHGGCGLLYLFTLSQSKTSYYLPLFFLTLNPLKSPVALKNVSHVRFTVSSTHDYIKVQHF